jgi:hypothetical protein
MCRKTEGGMMNGAEWLGKSFGGISHAGSLKDFSYLFTNTLELSLELTCCKFPTRYEANGPPRAIGRNHLLCNFKGTEPRDFDFRFFDESVSPQAPEYPI